MFTRLELVPNKIIFFRLVLILPLKIRRRQEEYNIVVVNGLTSFVDQRIRSRCLIFVTLCQTKLRLVFDNKKSISKASIVLRCCILKGSIIFCWYFLLSTVFCLFYDCLVGGHRICWLYPLLRGMTSIWKGCTRYDTKMHLIKRF